MAVDYAPNILGEDSLQYRNACHKALNDLRDEGRSAAVGLHGQTRARHSAATPGAPTVLRPESAGVGWRENGR